jgi:hypothetical protein
MNALRDIWHQLTGTGDWEIHCPTCQHPGRTSHEKPEVQSLADTHNHLHHRGRPVAVVRNA